MKKLIFAFACFVLAIPCQARIITVDWDGSGDYLTIQAAIDDSNDGDNIIVADGTYTGVGNRDMDFLGKAITLRSENGPDNCIIDCQGSQVDPHRGFKFHSGEGSDSVVTGFTIANGHGPLDYIGQYASSIGGAILCSTSSPTISNCNLRGNLASNGGAICCCEGSAPEIKNCAIENNSGFGGGIYCRSSNPEVINCVISNNIAPLDCSGGFPLCIAVSGGGIVSENSDPTISNCLINGNYAAGNGGGIYSYKGNPIINNCTIIGNSATGEAGGIRCYSGCVMTVSNCILWGNTASDGQQISLKKALGLCPTITISYCDIEGGQDQINIEDCGYVNWGLGNTDDTPSFANPTNGDYHLKSQAGRWDPNSQTWVQDANTSPCIDAGNPGCPLGDEPNDVNNVRINMGAYGGTAEASKSPANWRNIADMTNDWVVDSNDLKVFVDYWLKAGECIPSDLNRSQSVDFNDFAIFGLQWSYPSSDVPGMTFHVDDCNMEAGLSWSVAAESNEPRFSVWVEGRYIYFEDQIYANCCPNELGLDNQINGNEITLYEIGYGGMCPCMCYFPITATLGPFEDGTYTVEVYDNYGQTLGVVEVTIGQSPEPEMTFQIDGCSHFLAAEQESETRFTVTVEGRHVHFEDTMVANCCPDELGLEMTIEDNLITIYETEYTPGGCRCMCNYPVTATLGPFEPGTYTLDVYEYHGGFIGSTTVVIDLPQ